MGVGENLAQTPSPYLDAARISCWGTLSQIVDELRVATRMAKILQKWPLQGALAPKEGPPATAFSSL